MIDKPSVDPRWFQPGTKGNPDGIKPPAATRPEASPTESDDVYDRWIAGELPASVESAAVRPDPNSFEELTRRRREADAARAAIQRIGRPEMN